MTRFVAWFWMGMVFGVSFIATPVKFRALTLSMPVALDVGHVTLHALNRIEWLFAAVLLLFAVRHSGTARRLDSETGHPFARLGVLLGASAVCGVVAAQALWLLPALDVRTAEVIAGRPQPPSPLHGLFIGAEVLKLALLFGVGLAAGPQRLCSVEKGADDEGIADVKNT